MRTGINTLVELLQAKAPKQDDDTRRTISAKDARELRRVVKDAVSDANADGAMLIVYRVGREPITIHFDSQTLFVTFGIGVAGLAYHEETQKEYQAGLPGVK